MAQRNGETGSATSSELSRMESGSAGSSGTTGEGLGHTLCAFWIGERCFGVDTQLISEVVAVERVTFVPMVHPAVLGLFNLRGTPVALVDLSAVLSLPEPAKTHGDARTALVFRTGELVFAVEVDRMEAVIPEGRGHYAPTADDGDSLIQGFLEITGRQSKAISVFDATRLVDRIRALKARP